MTIDFQVLDSGHIMWLTVHEPWTFEEIHAVHDKVIAHLNNVNFTVHALLDATDMRSLPPGMVGIPAHDVLIHERTGFTAICRGTGLVRSMLEMLFKWERFEKYYMFSTYDEALAFLREIIRVGE